MRSQAHLLPDLRLDHAAHGALPQKLHHVQLGVGLVPTTIQEGEVRKATVGRSAFSNPHLDKVDRQLE
jgi:hypothetical protein